MYEQLSETTGVVKTGKYSFFLDSGETGLPEHGQMMIDFQDENKLSLFCNLLDENPSTAFLVYINTLNK